MNHNFNGLIELGSFLGSIDVLPCVYDAIFNTTSTYELHTSPSGFTVLAFSSNSSGYTYTARFLNGEFGLVSSESLKVVDFISTKVNPSFSINEAAVGLFQPLFVELSKLKDKLIYIPLVIAGRGLGGYIAVLFALWLQHVVDMEESNGGKGIKRPICITFGSPLVGDEDLQKAIFERPQWKPCFLNVVANEDPIPSLFSSNHAYKPLGTYLFCTESGGFTCFDDQDSILAVLEAFSASSSVENLMHDYKQVLGSIKRKVLYRGASEMIDPYVNNSLHVLIAKLEAKQANKIRGKRNVYDPTKKLNDMKISLTYMEWYMKKGREKGGYYDCFKSAKSKVEIERQQVIITHQRKLNQYWEKFVEEKDRMPQQEGAKLRKRWLYGGTNYRRIVEPLDIAEHYKKGKKGYMAARANHYKLLEKLIEGDKGLVSSDKRNKMASLTEDSCFWAHVEEALISLKSLKDGCLISDGAMVELGLVKFEEYVMGLIDGFLVSPDVFLVGSSFMKWWSEYKAYKGSLYASRFAQYMNDERYRTYE